MVFQQKSLIWDITFYGPTLTFATLKTRKELVPKYGPQKDLIHDARHLCSRSRIDRIKAMSRGISGSKQVIKFGKIRAIAVEFVCSIKTRQRLHSHANHTYGVLARFTLLLFAIRTSTVATTYKKVTMITSTHILTLSSLR